MPFTPEEAYLLAKDAVAAERRRCAGGWQPEPGPKPTKPPSGGSSVMPPQDYLKQWDDRIVALQNENKKLRNALVEILNDCQGNYAISNIRETALAALKE